MVILLAHGSRDPRWRMPFEVLISNFKNSFGQEKVELAYMEFCSPSIEEVVDKAYKSGITDLRFLPLFMAGGAHLRNDVPKIFDELQKGRRDLRLSLLSPIGEHPLVKEALSKVVEETLSSPHLYAVPELGEDSEMISISQSSS